MHIHNDRTLTVQIRKSSCSVEAEKDLSHPTIV